MKKTVLSCACALSVSVVSFAGDLNPPPGPVAPTFKTLDEVEPSTPIESLPGSALAQHVISEPGAYHLTGNMDLAGIGATAIRVESVDVTIDLRGFSIFGDATETLPMIRTALGTTVRNGTMRSWGFDGIEAFGGLVVEDVRFDFIQGSAIDNNSETVVRNCTFRACEPLDLAGDSLIDGCLFRNMSEAIASPGAKAVSIVDTVFDGQNTSGSGAVIVLGNDAKLHNVNVSNEGKSGLVAGLRATVIGCSFSGNNFGSNSGVSVGSGSIVKDCTITDYGLHGLSGTFSCVFEGNTIASCGGHGIECSGSRNVIRNNNVSTSAMNGIDVVSSARIVGNTVSFGSQNGIECDNECTISGNTLHGDPIVVNGDGNVIDSNDVLDISAGFSVTLGGEYNRLSRNSVSANIAITGPNNLFYPIRTAANYLTAGPWDNFRVAP